MADPLTNLVVIVGYSYIMGFSVMDQSSILGMAIMAIDHQAKQFWMTPIIEYLRSGVLLGNRAEAAKVKAQATRYSILNGELYKRSFSGSYLRHLPRKEAEHVMEQVHQGSWEMHIRGRTLCHRIVTQGYY